MSRLVVDLERLVRHLQLPPASDRGHGDGDGDDPAGDRPVNGRGPKGS
jgi:hypothetical protein